MPISRRPQRALALFASLCVACLAEPPPSPFAPPSDPAASPSGAGAVECSIESPGGLSLAWGDALPSRRSAARLGVRVHLEGAAQAAVTLEVVSSGVRRAAFAQRLEHDGVGAAAAFTLPLAGLLAGAEEDDVVTLNVFATGVTPAGQPLAAPAPLSRSLVALRGGRAKVYERRSLALAAAGIFPPQDAEPGAFDGYARVRVVGPDDGAAAHEPALERDAREQEEHP